MKLKCVIVLLPTLFLACSFLSPARTMPQFASTPAPTVTSQPAHTLTPTLITTLTPLLPTSMPTATPTPVAPEGLLAYSGPTEQGKIGLWLTNANGTGQRLLPTVVVWSQYAWSPDGRVLAYDFCSEGKGRDDGTGIRLYSPLDGSIRTLKAATMPDQYGCEPQYLGVWSPNGRYLALDIGTYPIGRAIKIVDVVADKLVALLTKLTYRGMAFSPDGCKLALGWQDVKDDVPYNSSVSLLDCATRQRQMVVQGEPGKDFYEVITWLADGRLLYKRHGADGKSSAWTIVPGSGSKPQPASNIPLEYDQETVLARIPENLRTPYTRFSFSPEKTWIAFEGEDGNSPVIRIMSWKTGEVISAIANGSNPAWQPQP